MSLFTTGFTVFLAMMLLLIKLPRRWALRMLHYDLAVDCAVSLVVLFLHFGSFEGVMAATIAGLMTSLFTTATKRAFGSLSSKGYQPGFFNLRA
jgi:hypothetical protein